MSKYDPTVLPPAMFAIGTPSETLVSIAVWIAVVRFVPLVALPKTPVIRFALAPAPSVWLVT